MPGAETPPGGGQQLVNGSAPAASSKEAGTNVSAAADKRPGGVRRLQWLAEIAVSRSFSPADLSVAGALAWRFTDRKTAETKVKIGTVASFLKCSERAVEKAFEKLQKGGWLAVVAPSKRKGEATWRRLTFPTKNATAPASANRAPAKGEPRRVQEPPWDWDQHEAHIVAWLNAETDPDEMKRRWESPAETKRRNAVCDNNAYPEHMFDLWEGYLKRRLRGEER
jgi:hypothetical protein